MRLIKRDEGSQVVEFGLVILPLLAIVFMIFDSAWVVFAKANLQSAVREGVRYAITSQTMSGMGQDASIRTIVQQNAFGFLNGPDGPGKIAISYFNPTTLAPTQANAGGNIVEVSVTGVSVTPMAPLWRSSDPFQISVNSSDVMESSPGGIPPPR